MNDWTDYGRFQTANPQMQEMLRAAEKVAHLQASIFISGSQGTGRRTLARWIFDRQPQRATRLMIWDPSHQETPRGGDTLLVENIDELSPTLLVKLRHVIDDVGSATGARARVIATSTLDARTWSETSMAARDLAYRICVVSLRVPDLQERTEDFLPLVNLFANVCCLVNGLPIKSLSAEAVRLLATRHWTGNVAELNNAVERAILSGQGHELSAMDFDFLGQDRHEEKSLRISQNGISLFEMEKKLILQTLELTSQNKTRAAQILGISIRTLRNKLNAYREGGVDVERLV